MASPMALAESCGEFHALGLMDEVEAADDALELGEFLYQLGGEIALGHERGFVDYAGAMARDETRRRWR